METGINYAGIGLPEFARRFAGEENCRKYLFKMRWPQGFVCPRCGHGEYYYHSGRKLCQCKACKYQASVTAGTVFHKTHTPPIM